MFVGPNPTLRGEYHGVPVLKRRTLRRSHNPEGFHTRLHKISSPRGCLQAHNPFGEDLPGCFRAVRGLGSPWQLAFGKRGRVLYVASVGNNLAGVGITAFTRGSH